MCDWLFVRVCVFIIANWRLITAGDGSERVKPGRTAAGSRGGGEIKKTQTGGTSLLLRDNSLRETETQTDRRRERWTDRKTDGRTERWSSLRHILTIVLFLVYLNKEISLSTK